MQKDNTSIRILVVDDDRNIRLLINQILQREGYSIIQASSGEEAVKEIEKNEFELVVTDLQMHRLTGIDVLKAAKARNPHTEVLILTGYGDIQTAVKAIKLGAYEYLSKPVNKDEFRVKVLKALEQRDMKFKIERQQQKIQEFNDMIARDLTLAGQVQRTLIPVPLQNGKVDVVVRHLPMIEIGGDFADVYFDDENNLYLTIIDVTGHGITAALMVNRLSTEVQRLVRDRKIPAKLVGALNDFVLDNLSNTGLFLTMFSLQVDVTKKSLTYAGAAHPAAVVWRSNVARFDRLYSQNTIVGFQYSNKVNFTQDTTELYPGDKIFLYTDGIIESENNEGVQFGVGRFFDILSQNITRSSQELTDIVINEVQQYCNGILKDDIYLMIAELK